MQTGLFKIGIMLVLIFVVILGTGLVVFHEAVPRHNSVESVFKSLSPYMPGRTMSGCSYVYQSFEYVSCMLYDLPGADFVSLTASEYSGEIVATFVNLSEPVRIGDLVSLYGSYKFEHVGSWIWTWPGVSVYKYSTYGYPSKMTEIRMISWHKQ